MKYPFDYSGKLPVGERIVSFAYPGTKTAPEGLSVFLGIVGRNPSDKQELVRVCHSDSPMGTAMDCSLGKIRWAFPSKNPEASAPRRMSFGKKDVLDEVVRMFKPGLAALLCVVGRRVCLLPVPIEGGDVIVSPEGECESAVDGTEIEDCFGLSGTVWTSPGRAFTAAWCLCDNGAENFFQQTNRDFVPTNTRKEK